jgi:hypothetical protein
MRAAFYQSLKSKVGLAAGKAAALRINLNIELCAGFWQCGSFEEVCAVGCVLLRGRGLVLVRGGGTSDGICVIMYV